MRSSALHLSMETAIGTLVLRTTLRERISEFRVIGAGRKRELLMGTARLVGPNRFAELSDNGKTSLTPIWRQKLSMMIRLADANRQK